MMQSWVGGSLLMMQLLSDITLMSDITLLSDITLFSGWTYSDNMTQLWVSGPHDAVVGEQLVLNDAVDE